ncbi:pilus assembly protein PilP [Piscinibacter terrae]|uniref:Pilus assembly protein PilP n=1 Tax=Piscinibacter terrae TaxID=2496871 RepID=A0A3N7JYZ2_9BURK|nr:pilus assembly protein PilP [Albitalea terrae]RQP24045.1 hypothetical protein DZC73_11955 [Albitalea terrae]
MTDGKQCATSPARSSLNQVQEVWMNRMRLPALAFCLTGMFLSPWSTASEAGDAVSITGRGIDAAAVAVTTASILGQSVIVADRRLKGMSIDFSVTQQSWRQVMEQLASQTHSKLTWMSNVAVFGDPSAGTVPYSFSLSAYPLESYDSDALRVKGLVQFRGQYFGLVESPDAAVWVAKRGDGIGKNIGRVTQLDQGGVTFREMVRNDQGEWTERVKVLSLAGPK